MLELSNLKAPRGSNSKRKRVGRGNASGWGRTSGRGEKGQMSRSGGKVRIGFEGGQMPLYRRVPKVGFRSRKSVLGLNRYVIVNVSDLNRLDDGAVFDSGSLKLLGIKAGSKERAGVKLLGCGELSKKITVRVQAISESARKKVEAAGGNVELVKLSGQNSADEVS
ncbi:MAG: 50S ribosomal protein L15 [Candidatus Dadabacteria bacterium]|nr:MAG: 50S ribosomal protein L15 [Candidatus Dadabacteria bacterium]